MFNLAIDDIQEMRVKVLAGVLGGAFKDDLASRACELANHLRDFAALMDREGDTVAFTDTWTVADAMTILAHAERSGDIDKSSKATR